jgi:hypothetical protein
MYRKGGVHVSKGGVRLFAPLIQRTCHCQKGYHGRVGNPEIPKQQSDYAQRSTGLRGYCVTDGGP